MLTISSLLLSNTLIMIAPVACLLYVSVCVAASLYIVSFKSGFSKDGWRSYSALSRKLLNGVINCQASLIVVIALAARLSCAQCLCGHFSVSHSAVSMAIFIFVVYFVVQKFIISELWCGGRELWNHSSASGLICVFLQLLWFISSVYALIFCLDCLGALVLLTVFNCEKRSGTAETFNVLNGVSVLLWVSFIASTLLLVSCSSLINLISSIEIKNVIVFGAILEKASRAGEDTKLQLASLLLVLALVIKTGLCGLFVWKRAFLRTLNACGLLIYLVLYFGNVTIYTASLVLSMGSVLLGVRSVVMAVAAASLILAVASCDKNFDVFSFFAWSSYFNTMLVFCVILAELKKPSSVTGDALSKILWHKVI